MNPSNSNVASALASAELISSVWTSEMTLSCWNLKLFTVLILWWANCSDTWATLGRIGLRKPVRKSAASFSLRLTTSSYASRQKKLAFKFSGSEFNDSQHNNRFESDVGGWWPPPPPNGALAPPGAGK